MNNDDMDEPLVPRPKPKFHYAALVLILQAFQILTILGAVACVYFLEDTIRPFLLQYFWIGISAGFVYLVVIFVVLMLKDGLRKSSACYFLFALVIVSESVLLSYLSLIHKPVFVFDELIILGAGLVGTFLFALCMRQRYSHEIGAFIACIWVGATFIVIVLNKPKDDVILAVTHYLVDFKCTCCGLYLGTCPQGRQTSGQHFAKIPARSVHPAAAVSHQNDVDSESCYD